MSQSGSVPLFGSLLGIALPALGPLYVNQFNR